MWGPLSPAALCRDPDQLRLSASSNRHSRDKPGHLDYGIYAEVLDGGSIETGDNLDQEQATLALE
ncbi:hypothetical protein [Microvirga sp. VF16]|uniref:hypothetical protein n=1 Tax=Microvirga sp. VF16 TaxID=2807101 RepID=UPI00193E8CA7|nr:hypothetical protein [Microvirga sp. VF16]QRM29993.1 hypothetical protein JO965_02990 [Microvirga sp. VF16]